jgi:hypothetical protein
MENQQNVTGTTGGNNENAKEKAAFNQENQNLEEQNLETSGAEGENEDLGLGEGDVEINTQELSDNQEIDLDRSGVNTEKGNDDKGLGSAQG